MGDDKNNVKICRVCLDSNLKKCVSLFDVYKDYLVFDYVNSIANVKIQRSDGLPDKICLGCLLELETAVNFKQKCESSNVILQTTHLGGLSESAANPIPDIEIKKEEPLDEPTEDQFDYADVESQLYGDDDLHAVANWDPGEDEHIDLRKSRAVDLNLECHDCGDRFKSKCKLRVHWKKIHLPATLICQVCKRVFKSFKAYNRHRTVGLKTCNAAANVRIEGQGKNRVFYCKDCSYKTTRIKDIQTHLVTHSGERPFACDLCPRWFTQQSSMQAHKESHHKEYKYQITCQYCGKLVKGRTKIYRHLKTHTDNKHQCPVCTKMLQSKKSLQTHMQRHSGVKQYTCEVCAKSFFTAAELCNHKRAIHMKGKYWYYCHLCEFKSMRSDKVKKHKGKHTAINIPCTVCGMFFEQADKLARHQRLHFGERKHGCPMCEKRFFRKDTVGKHIRAKHRYIVPTQAVEKKVVVKKEVLAVPTKELIEIEIPAVVEIN